MQTVSVPCPNLAFTHGRSCSCARIEKGPSLLYISLKPLKQSLASGTSTAAQASRKKARVRRWVDSVPLPAYIKKLGMKVNCCE